MARFNGNNPVLTLGGLNIAGVWTSVSITPSNSPVETTAGAGTEHMTRNPGLSSHEASIAVAYDDGNIETIIQKLKVGTVQRMVWGPEGSANGKPKHEQDFIVTGAPVTQTVAKDFVTIEASLTSADGPISDMHNGDTY